MTEFYGKYSERNKNHAGRAMSAVWGLYPEADPARHPERAKSSSKGLAHHEEKFSKSLDAISTN